MSISSEIFVTKLGKFRIQQDKGDLIKLILLSPKGELNFGLMKKKEWEKFLKKYVVK